MRSGWWLVLLSLAAGACVNLDRPPGLETRLPGDAGPDRPMDVPIDQPVERDNGDPAETGDGAGDQAGDGEVGDGGEDPADARLSPGRACDQAAQCGSGFCVQGVCCESACTDGCYACNLPAALGVCTPVPAGDDPREHCPRDLPASCGFDGTCDGAGACRRYPVNAECEAGGCTGGVERSARTCSGDGVCRPGTSAACASGNCTADSCAAACSPGVPCQPGFFCQTGHCARTRLIAEACTRAEECASGFCVDGVCCTSQCGDRCFACAVPGSIGTCKPVPAGQDLRQQCSAESSVTCGRVGGCDGAGACAFHPAGTTCVGSNCFGGSEIPARKCDGLGVCRVVAARRDCAPYACTSATCASQCSDGTACAPGYSCQSNVCVRSPGLQLFWRFEEAFGATAFDSSGNGLGGIYAGENGTPRPSTMLPKLGYPNLLSRAFDSGDRHYVHMPTLPPSLRFGNDFTLSAWYRATSLDTNGGGSSGGEIVSGANSYIVRLRAGFIEFARRVGTTNTFTQLRATPPPFLDGQWHHVAAVASRTTGAKLYFDGEAIGTTAVADNVGFPDGSDGLWVGRHGAGQTIWDFGGNIDEVRIYNRPLDGLEIKALASGSNH